MSDQLVGRLGQVLSLLRSRDLYDAPLPTTTGRMIRQNTRAKAGEGNEEWIDCPDCGGNGRKRIRGIEQTCPRCRGRALILVDQYTGRELGSEKTAVRSAAPLRRVPCDACIGLDPKKDRGEGFVHGERCPHCDGSGWAPAFAQRMQPFRRKSSQLDRALLEGLRDPILRAMVVKGALGSYDELSSALAALRVADLASYAATVALETDRRSVKEIRYDLAASFGLLFVERRMPEPIRIPPDVVAIDRRAAAERRRSERERRREQAA